MARKASAPAYFLVDLSNLSADDRQEIMDDATMGGGDFGIKVVEEVHNGPVAHPIYGVYYVDEAKWNAAKEEFPDLQTVEDEAKVRAEADTQANAQAQQARAAEDAEIQAIAKDDDTSVVNKAKAAK